MMTPHPIPVAYFISAHGLGHAARAAAVMAAVQRARPEVRFEIFTLVPHWFFADSLPGPFTCHTLKTDVGLIQKSPLAEDLPATIEALDAFYPLAPQKVATVAAQVRSLDCQAVLCDIAPMGIAVARAAGCWSCLIENFTWDWIYAGYGAYARRLQPHIAYLQALFAAADYHIHTQPVCGPGLPDLTVGPVSREPRTAKASLRRRLQIDPALRLVVVTLGGTAISRGQLRYDVLPEDVFLVVPGTARKMQRHGKILLLPARSGVYHPDLVHAADAVIGKIGYSTIAEVYQAGIPFGYVSRSGFRESPVLEVFVRETLRSVKVTAKALQSGSWTEQIDALTTLPPVESPRDSGATDIAGFLFSILKI